MSAQDKNTVDKEMQKSYFSPIFESSHSNNSNRFMKRLLQFLFILIGFMAFQPKQAQATHIMGADIIYRCVDTLKFEFTFKFYRDCRGIAMPTWPVNIRCLDKSVSQSMGRLSTSTRKIRDVTPVCATTSSCGSSANSAFSSKGIEEHSYTMTIDFNSSTLKKFVSQGCCWVRIETSQNARNGAITTGPSGSVYTYADVNICKAPCNSSPALTSEPIGYLCCNQPFFFNNGAADTAQFDSLSYAWSHPMRGYNQNTSYSGKYSYREPFQVYYPGNLKWPYVNTSANPPIGIFLDSLNGDIILTPTKCDEVTVAVLEITEWRKKADGSYEEIGRTRRDMQFEVTQCPANNPPTIKIPDAKDRTVCEGSTLCFNIYTDDKPHASNPNGRKDTVTLKWNGGIPGATFKITNKGDRLETGQFCWTPPVGSARSLPYQFTVTARDDACPYNAISVRSVGVIVKQLARTVVDIDTLPCGEYTITSNVTSGFKGTPQYEWNILDSNQNIILDRKVAFFRSTKSFLSRDKSDTILFRKGGFYIIQHTINNAPNCPNIYLDTLIVPDLLEVDLALGPDTFLCAGTDFEISPELKNATNKPLKYQWFTADEDGNDLKFLPNDTTDTYLLRVPNVEPDTLIGLFVTDAIGCTAFDSIVVYLKPNPTVVLPEDRRICSYDSTLVLTNTDLAYWIDPNAGDTLVQGDTLFTTWTLNGGPVFSTDTSVMVRQRGEYVASVIDSLGCQSSDTFYLFVNDTVKANAGPDQLICFDDVVTLTASGMDTLGHPEQSGTYIWFDITTNAPSRTNLGTDETLSFNLQQTTDYELILQHTVDTVMCQDEDTVRINVDPLPLITLGNQDPVCCDYGDIQLTQFEKPDSSKGGKWFSLENPSYIFGTTFQTDAACNPDTQTVNRIYYQYTHPKTGCTGFDSMDIVVNKLPVITLNEGLFFCQDDNEARLSGKTVVRNFGILNNGYHEFNCLDCNGYDENDLIENRGSQLFPDYYLLFDKQTYQLQQLIDTVTLEIVFVDGEGCVGRDTTDIAIGEVPVITFASMPEPCWDGDPVSLNEVSGVNITNGVWSAINEPGFRNVNDLGGLKGDTVTPMSSVPLANFNATPSHFYLRYEYINSASCYARNDTAIKINPLPDVNVTPLDDAYCETSPDVALQATPGGGTWTSSDPGARSGSNTNFAGAIKDQTVWYYYNYSHPVSNCKASDSTLTYVEAQPTITMLTPPMDTCREDVINYDLEISYVNKYGIEWYLNPKNGFSFDQQNGVATNDTTATLTFAGAPNDTTTAYNILIRTEKRADQECDAVTASWSGFIHPTPDVTITPDNADGCNPVDVNWELTINNKIDPILASYQWDLNDGDVSNAQNPFKQYTTDGPNPNSVLVTSDKGCDTTVTGNIDVYPIPVAAFTPDPNNFTTAALPKFKFTDNSFVDDAGLSSTVTEYYWDFGEVLIDTDTSTERNPIYWYEGDTGTYMVTFTVVTNYGCENTVTGPVEIGPDITVFIPNVFTPDGAGPSDNDDFNIIVFGEKTFELIIFNRWGEQVFVSNNKEDGWDGTYKDAPCQQDVYAYKLVVTSLDDEPYEYNGTITLIR